jgi:hypothetical protein
VAARRCRAKHAARRRSRATLARSEITVLLALTEMEVRSFAHLRFEEDRERRAALRHMLIYSKVPRSVAHSGSAWIPSSSKEIPMRITCSIILGVATLFVAAPSSAQTYDPRYPVCMKVYSGPPGGGEWIDCSYTSLPQCQFTASGRAAMCEINPFFAYAQTPPDRVYRRPYRPRY